MKYPMTRIPSKVEVSREKNKLSIELFKGIKLIQNRKKQKFKYIQNSTLKISENWN